MSARRSGELEAWTVKIRLEARESAKKKLLQRVIEGCLGRAGTTGGNEEGANVFNLTP